MTELDIASARDVDDEAASLPTRRFHSLDVLRGVAALGVIFWHWQHFFYDGMVPGQPLQDRLPLHFLFSPFYRGGWLMVDGFFSLSGFIFFWLYAQAIAERRVSFRAFAILRLSRLYPLHLTTLLVVLLGQALLLPHSGSRFVYDGGAGDFVQQLLLVHGWKNEIGESFNGPSWSISVEVLLYLAFFGLCRSGFRRWWHFIAVAAIGAGLTMQGIGGVGRGLFSFFLGGMAFHGYKHLRSRRPRLGGRFWLAIAVAASALSLYLLQTNTPVLYNGYTFLCGERLLVNGRDPLGGILLVLSPYVLTGLVFPLLIMALALAETKLGLLGRRWGWLGDISYSCYLWHFPLQLGAIMLVYLAGISREVFYSPFGLVAFFGVLIGISFASHRWFEMPVQKWLRRRLLR